MGWFLRSAGLFAVGCLFLIPGGRADEEKQPTTETVMRKKLTNAHMVLEGIAVNDFKKTAEGAKGLIDASKEAGWMILQTPEYQLHSDEFRRAARDVIAAAEKKQTERAALAYVDLTLTCVKCHRHIRDQGIGLNISPENLRPGRKTLAASE